MLLNYLEGLLKRFWGGDDVSFISSSDATMPDSGVKATVSGFVGSISATSYGFVAPHETGARGGGIFFLMSILNLLQGYHWWV